MSSRIMPYSSSKSIKIRQDSETLMNIDPSTDASTVYDYARVVAKKKQRPLGRIGLAIKAKLSDGQKPVPMPSWERLAEQMRVTTGSARRIALANNLEGFDTKNRDAVVAFLGPLVANDFLATDDRLPISQKPPDSGHTPPSRIASTSRRFREEADMVALAMTGGGPVDWARERDVLLDMIEQIRRERDQARRELADANGKPKPPSEGKNGDTKP